MSGETVPVTEQEDEAFKELAAALARVATNEAARRFTVGDDRGVWAFYE